MSHIARRNLDTLVQAFLPCQEIHIFIDSRDRLLSTSRLMELRNHPLMSHHGLANWPPRWTTTRNQSNVKPEGEVGILNEVLLHELFNDKLFLVIEYEAQMYMAALVFDDPAFCNQLYALLQSKYGLSIREIGDLDLSHTL
jgi:hypothetical protein